MPPFIHCAQDSPQPPFATPAQFKVAAAAAASAHVPVAGLPNCWKTGAGADGEVELDEPPDGDGVLPVNVNVPVAPAAQVPEVLVKVIEPPDVPVTVNTDDCGAPVFVPLIAVTPVTPDRAREKS